MFHLLAILAADALAISLICVMLIMSCVLVSLVLIIAKSARNKDPQQDELDRLLSEIEKEECQEVRPTEKGNSERKEWEQEADWWKNEE